MPIARSKQQQLALELKNNKIRIILAILHLALLDLATKNVDLMNNDLYYNYNRLKLNLLSKIFVIQLLTITSHSSSILLSSELLDIKLPKSIS